MPVLASSAPSVSARVAGNRQAVGLSRSFHAAPGRTALRVVAFRGDKSRGSTSGVTKTKVNTRSKQRAVQPPSAPRSKKENKDSVVTFVAIASLFLTGVLFVLPALLGGAPATTVPLQQGINKTFGIEDNSDAKSLRGKPYAPGPGPAAAPGTPATQQ